MSLGSMLRTDLIKTLAALFLFFVVMSALAIAAYDKIANLPVDSTIQTVLVSAISLSLSVLGFNHGIATANGVAKDTAVAVMKAQKEGNPTP